MMRDLDADPSETLDAQREAVIWSRIVEALKSGAIKDPARAEFAYRYGRSLALFVWSYQAALFAALTRQHQRRSLPRWCSTRESHRLIKPLHELGFSQLGHLLVELGVTPKPETWSRL